MANYKLIATALLTIGSVVGVREYLKPRDIENLLKWKGITLIDSKNDNAWKASLHENKEKLKTIGIENYEKLRDWCSSQMKQGITDELASSAEKYCQDNPKTIMGHIIRDGEEERLINETDAKALQIVFVLSSDREELKRVMEIKSTEEQKNDFKYMGEQVNKWCNDQKKSKVQNEAHLSNVKKYCYDKKVKTIKELLEKEKLQVLTEEGYKERFEGELIKAPELISQMKHVLEAIKEQESRKISYPFIKKEEIATILAEGKIDEEFIKKSKNGGKLFQWYCEVKYTEDLTGSAIFPTTYEKIKGRCTTKKN